MALNREAAIEMLNVLLRVEDEDRIETLGLVTRTLIEARQMMHNDEIIKEPIDKPTNKG